MPPETIIFVSVSVVLVIAAVPLVRRRVPPNSLYGVRLPDTLADEHVWYEVNARSGRDMLVVAAASGMAAVVIPLTTSVPRPLDLFLVLAVLNAGMITTVVRATQHAQDLRRGRGGRSGSGLLTAETATSPSGVAESGIRGEVAHMQHRGSGAEPAAATEGSSPRVEAALSRIVLVALLVSMWAGTVTAWPELPRRYAARTASGGVRVVELTWATWFGPAIAATVMAAMMLACSAWFPRVAERLARPATPVGDGIVGPTRRRAIGVLQNVAVWIACLMGLALSFGQLRMWHALRGSPPPSIAAAEPWLLPAGLGLLMISAVWRLARLASRPAPPAGPARG